MNKLDLTRDEVALVELYRAYQAGAEQNRYLDLDPNELGDWCFVLHLYTDGSGALVEGQNYDEHMMYGHLPDNITNGDYEYDGVEATWETLAGGVEAINKWIKDTATA